MEHLFHIGPLFAFRACRQGLLHGLHDGPPFLGLGTRGGRHPTDGVYRYRVSDSKVFSLKFRAAREAPQLISVSPGVPATYSLKGRITMASALQRLCARPRRPVVVFGEEPASRRARIRRNSGYSEPSLTLKSPPGPIPCRATTYRRSAPATGKVRTSRPSRSRKADTQASLARATC